MRFSESPVANPESPLFVLVAGEASGDLLGAGLIASLRERFPDARFAGVGGPRMIDAGFDAWHSSDELAVMGLVEVLKHLPRLLAIRRDVRRRTLAARPVAFIGIDAPDFSFGLERALKSRGIRTIHYVSPSIWAWRAKRARTIGKSADLVLCLFPFEPAIYAEHGVAATFVGHPLADTFPLESPRGPARAALGLPVDAPVLALLPGSRLGEIERLAGDFIGAAMILRREIPDLRVVAPMANRKCRDAFECILRDTPASRRAPESGNHEATGSPANGCRPRAAESAPAAASASASASAGDFITVLDNHAHESMLAADAILLASGTASLEAMLAKRPMVVAYRLAPLTYRIVMGLGMLQTDRYSLPNVLAGRALVPERMQDACTPDALADALRPSLAERRVPMPLLAEYQHLHLTLRRDASRSAAAAIAALIEGRDAGRAE